MPRLQSREGRGEASPHSVLGLRDRLHLQQELPPLAMVDTGGNINILQETICKAVAKVFINIWKKVYYGSTTANLSLVIIIIPRVPVFRKQACLVSDLHPGERHCGAGGGLRRLLGPAQDDGPHLRRPVHHGAQLLLLFRSSHKVHCILAKETTNNV